MKRFLFILLPFVTICSTLQSCKDENLHPAGILVQWLPSEHNALFPSGCRIDSGDMEYDGLTYNLGSCDAVIYSSNSVTPHSSPESVYLSCRIEDGDSVFDIQIHDILAFVNGPEGKGYEETYIYFRGGFLALLRTSDGYYDNSIATTAEVYRDGVKYSVSSVDVSGYWINNREFRSYYAKFDTSWEEITKNLEYECDITIELEVEGKPLTLNITHISPLK